MSTEFNELLNFPHDSRAQVWLVGSREQVQHLINEMYVKRIITDRSQFSPPIPVPAISGKYMSVCMR
jgi:hypothetical protein